MAEPNASRPHLDQIRVRKLSYASALPAGFSVADFLLHTAQTQISRGAPENLFGGHLQWSFSGTGYIGENTGLPDRSLELWQSDRPLSLTRFDDRIYFVYHTSPEDGYYFPYTGQEKAPASIPEKTLIRLQLSEWTRHPQSGEKRCELELADFFL